MKKFLLAAAGGAVGTLIYTGVFSNTPELDWYRAAFVGCGIGLVTALSARSKSSTPPADKRG
ncbi:MAG TPA: hypothetical protein DDZ22_12455 [Massilia sp.]|nr:hypothetical protein [Massilia sp.]